MKLNIKLLVILVLAIIPSCASIDTVQENEDEACFIPANPDGEVKWE